MVTSFLCAFLFCFILQGQEIDNSISVSYFMYPIIENIPIILDESGGNSFFLDTHYPRIQNDYYINHVMVDGSLYLPQGSYFLPELFPNGLVPDSIVNISQIDYRKGDYGLGELGIALQIDGDDSSYFSLQGFRQTPPIIYFSSSAGNDNLQNYLISYERLFKKESISVDVMYHMEDFHLPLLSGLEYKREVESFHSGLGFKKRWNNIWLDLHPAFQMTHVNRQDSLATYFTLWNKFNLKFDLNNHVNLTIQQQFKMMMAEQDSQLTKIAMNTVRQKLRYYSGGVTLEGGGIFFGGIFELEGKAMWRYKDIYFAVSREFKTYFEPKNMSEYDEIDYSIISLNIGYISMPLKVILDIFQIRNSGDDQPGVLGEIEIDLSWIKLYQKTGMYNINQDSNGPLKMFNQMSLLFSPNVWHWRTARFQPFIGVESIYLQHSGRTAINPTRIPIIEGSELESYTSNIINIELGIIVKRFKVSYRFEQINILENTIVNSSLTHPLQPVQQLVVRWQFWN